MTFNTPLEIGQSVPIFGWSAAGNIITGFKFGKHRVWLARIIYRDAENKFHREWFTVETVEKWVENAAKGKE